MSGHLQPSLSWTWSPSLRDTADTEVTSFFYPDLELDPGEILAQRFNASPNE